MLRPRTFAAPGAAPAASGAHAKATSEAQACAKEQPNHSRVPAPRPVLQQGISPAPRLIVRTDGRCLVSILRGEQGTRGDKGRHTSASQRCLPSTFPCYTSPACQFRSAAAPSSQHPSTSTQHPSSSAARACLKSIGGTRSLCRQKKPPTNGRGRALGLEKDSGLPSQPWNKGKLLGSREDELQRVARCSPGRRSACPRVKLARVQHCAVPPRVRESAKRDYLCRVAAAGGGGGR